MKRLMTADEILEDPEGWLKTRDGMIGASEIGAVLGLEDAYSTPTQVFYRKKYGDRSSNRLRFRVGHALEPLMVELMAEAEPALTLDEGGLYVSDARPHIGATFDALGWLDYDGLGPRPVPVQMKTEDYGDRDRWGDPPYGVIPTLYQAQVTQEIDVADALEARLVVLFGLGQEFRIYRIERNEDVEADIAVFREVAGDFYRRLLEDDPPPVDWRKETTKALRQVYAKAIDEVVDIPKGLARRREAALRAYDLAERRLGLTENEIRARIGTAKVAVERGTGREVARRSVYPEKRVSVTELREQEPEIAARFERESPVDKLLRGRDMPKKRETSR